MAPKNTSLEDAWRSAIRREKSAYEFYKQSLETLDDAALKSLFTYLAGEEKKHWDMLQDEFDKHFTPDN
jgi:rubrerythrin